MTVVSFWKVIPWRSEAYRDFVISLPCALTGHLATDYLGVDPHHEQRKGHGGKSTKACDSRMIPIRHDLHLRMETRGNSRASVYAEFGKDPEQIVAETQAAWIDRFGTTPWLEAA